LHISAALVIALIAVQTLIVSQLGLRLGARLSERVREGAERLAGVALTTLGASASDPEMHAGKQKEGRVAGVSGARDARTGSLAEGEHVTLRAVS
jgi:hypothetical protein